MKKINPWSYLSHWMRKRDTSRWLEVGVRYISGGGHVPEEKADPKPGSEKWDHMTKHTTWSLWCLFSPIEMNRVILRWVKESGQQPAHQSSVEGIFPSTGVESEDRTLVSVCPKLGFNWRVV